ncbi:UDP-N-acetyl glucosamine-2-epimerase [Syntrophobacter sp. SbD1]|nr:UDP-N-acetyl glucosamine-2-epimerase [Syntrophobacter sp. SbD1]
MKRNFKVFLVLGTRPEAIKLAPVILELRKRCEFDCRVCVTAQHREMLDQVLQVFDIVPDLDLNLMRPDQTLSGLTSRAIETLDGVFAVEKPDLVLVQGDTATCFSAALTSFYHHIAVGHVEAGLRTGNLYSPWPEEANRVLTSRLATLHFAPTEVNSQNLLREGIEPAKIFVTGNTVIDALFIALEKIKSSPPDIPGLPAGITASWNGVRMVLITGHRRENFGQGFESICQSIAELANRFADVQFVYPVHLNPNVREPVMKILGSGGKGNIHLIDPLPYFPFIAMMHRSTLILTDSGGIQEEAPSLGKPVLVMRDTTERPEAVSAGTARLVGTDFRRIVMETSRLLTDKDSYDCMAGKTNPYGDGQTANRIVRICGEFLQTEKYSG